MESVVVSVELFLVVSYVAVTTLYGYYFFHSNQRISRYLKLALPVTISLHLIGLVLLGIYLKRFPAANIYELASLISLSIALVYWYVEFRLNIQTTGFMILCVVSLIQVFSTAFLKYDLTFQVPEIFSNPMFIIHTSTVTLGYAALSISALYGLMYLALYYKLKTANFGIIYYNMPSLEELGDMNFRAATFGFICITATIFAGMIWRKNAFPDIAHFDPIVVSTYLIWTIYGIMLIGKKFGHWKSISVAYLSIYGFVVILLSVTIVNLFLSTFHRFGMD